MSQGITHSEVLLISYRACQLAMGKGQSRPTKKMFIEAALWTAEIIQSYTMTDRTPSRGMVARFMLVKFGVLNPQDEIKVA